MATSPSATTARAGELCGERRRSRGQRSHWRDAGGSRGGGPRVAAETLLRPAPALPCRAAADPHGVARHALLDVLDRQVAEELEADRHLVADLVVDGVRDHDAAGRGRLCSRAAMLTPSP